MARQFVSLTDEANGNAHGYALQSGVSTNKLEMVWGQLLSIKKKLCFLVPIDYPRPESEAPTWEMRRGYNSEEEDPTSPEKKHFPEPPCLIGIQLPP